MNSQPRMVTTTRQSQHPQIMRVDDGQPHHQGQHAGHEDQRARADELLQQAGIGVALGEHAARSCRCR